MLGTKLEVSLHGGLLIGVCWDGWLYWRDCDIRGR